MAPLKNFTAFLLSEILFGYMQLQQSPCIYKCMLSLNVVCVSFHLVDLSIFFVFFVYWVVFFNVHYVYRK